MSKIPNHAKKVFKGEIFEVYQWEQKQFDDSFATYEALKRNDTVVVIPITKDGKIILIEEAQPHYAMHLKPIAGKVDSGETPKEAAERELLEETGYKCNVTNLWYEQNMVSKIDWTVHTFIAKDCEKVAPQNLEPGERINPILFTFNEFIDKVSSEDFPNPTLKIKILEAKLEPQKMVKLQELFSQS